MNLPLSFRHACCALALAIAVVGSLDSLLAAVDRALARGPAMTDAEARDPDISFRAYLAWCAEQPATPAQTWAAWRAGAFRLDSPLAGAAAPEAA